MRTRIYQFDTSDSTKNTCNQHIDFKYKLGIQNIHNLFIIINWTHFRTSVSFF